MTTLRVEDHGMFEREHRWKRIKGYIPQSRCASFMPRLLNVLTLEVIHDTLRSSLTRPRLWTRWRILKECNLVPEAHCLRHHCLAGRRCNRNMTMRATYLALDRAQIGNCGKNMARRMQQPREAAMRRLRRLLLEAPSSCAEQCAKAMVDGGDAGDLNTKRSTVGPKLAIPS